MTNDINALNLSQQNEIELQKIYTELGISDIKFMLNPSNSVSFDMCVEHTLAVFLSGKDKVEQFKKELKELLAKYDAELTIEDFGRDWSSDEKMVVTFNWDEDLANRTNDGIVPDWVVGRWENGR